MVLSHLFMSCIRCRNSSEKGKRTPRILISKFCSLCDCQKGLRNTLNTRVCAIHIVRAGDIEKHCGRK